MSEMVERCAVALYEFDRRRAVDEPPNWDLLHENIKEAYRGGVRAALEAIPRDPTKAMIEAYRTAIPDYGRPGVRWPWRKKAKARWQAMLDTALKETG